MIFYVLHIFLIDEFIRDRIYDIHFTEDQIIILEQLLEMLDVYIENEGDQCQLKE